MFVKLELQHKVIRSQTLYDFVDSKIRQKDYDRAKLNEELKN